MSSDFWSHSLVRLKSTIRRSRPAFRSAVRALGAVKGAKRDRATRERSCENCRDWRPLAITRLELMHARLRVGRSEGAPLCANEDETSAHQEFRLEGAEG
jgi:hypothetical protein